MRMTLTPQPHRSLPAPGRRLRALLAGSALLLVTALALRAAASANAVTLTATASGNATVTTVSYFIDGVLSSTSTTTPSTYTWDTTGLAPGSTHTFSSKVTVMIPTPSPAPSPSPTPTPSPSNIAPTVATPASATPNPVTGTTTNLSVLGADDGGEANLTYTWAATSAPSGAPAVTFSANGTNAAKNTTATFYKAGSYTLRATITDAGGLTVTSSKTLTVSQTVTSLVLYPGTLTLAAGASQAFTPAPKDQFGTYMSPAYAWTLTGVGTLNSANGVYTAPASGGGTATIQVSAGGFSASASVTVDTTFTPGIFFDAATGALRIQANSYNNTILIKLSAFDPSKVVVTLSGTDSLGNLVVNASQQVPLTQITSIVFYGQSAFNVTFTNNTALACTAYGGTGTNHLTGGSGADWLYAGPIGPNSTLEGMGGDDVLVGGAGTSLLSGGTGNNTLVPGTGVTYYF